MSVSLITRDKWEKLKALSDAIVRQRAIYEESKTYQNALDLQNLENQRIALRSTVGFAVIEGGKKDEGHPHRPRDKQASGQTAS